MWPNTLVSIAPEPYGGTAGSSPHAHSCTARPVADGGGASSSWATSGARIARPWCEEGTLAASPCRDDAAAAARHRWRRSK